MLHTLFWARIIEVHPWKSSKIQFHHWLLHWTSAVLLSHLSNVIFQVFSPIKPWGSLKQESLQEQQCLVFKNSNAVYKENRLFKNRIKKFALLRYLSGRKLCCQAVFLFFFIPVCVYLTLLDLEKKMHWTRRILFTVKISFSPLLVVLQALNTFRSFLMTVQNYTL